MKEYIEVEYDGSVFHVQDLDFLARFSNETNDMVHLVCKNLFKGSVSAAMDKVCTRIEELCQQKFLVEPTVVVDQFTEADRPCACSVKKLCFQVRITPKYE